MCVCVGAYRVTMGTEIRGHSSTFGCGCRCALQQVRDYESHWVRLEPFWTPIIPYQSNTLWPSRYAGSCARRFLCMPRRRCQSHQLLGHWPLFAVRQIFLNRFLSRDCTIGGTARSMTRAFAFLPSVLQLRQWLEVLAAQVCWTFGGWSRSLGSRIEHQGDCISCSRCGWSGGWGTMFDCPIILAISWSPLEFTLNPELIWRCSSMF